MTASFQLFTDEIRGGGGVNMVGVENFVPSKMWVPVSNVVVSRISTFGEHNWEGVRNQL